MLIVETVTACIPAYVAVAIFARTWWHKRKHSRCLANIAQLEHELGYDAASQMVESFNRAIQSGKWARSVSAKQANYMQGMQSFLTVAGKAPQHD